MTLNNQLENLVLRYPVLEECRESISSAFELMAEAFSNGSKMLIAGNGGSASDAEHIVGELMKSFCKQRSLDASLREKLEAVDPELGKTLSAQLQGALPAIALDGHFALTTAYMNDCNPLLAFSQQVNGYGKPGDVLLAISTSGNSKNIVCAAVTARAKGMKVVTLTGAKACRLDSLSDVAVHVPETETYKIQELHLPVYHALCLMLEERFFV